MISPLQTLSLYNAVANDGKMMKPYLVNNIQLAGRIIKQNQPAVLVDKICSEETLRQLKECLEGVCVEGTAKNVFKNAYYKTAGKTGTALVANGNRGYADHIYQSSFVGYFPADFPKYSCIVVIKNKPFAKKFLGASVAGPVFREVADKLLSTDPSLAGRGPRPPLRADSSEYYYTGTLQDLRKVAAAINISYQDSGGKAGWGAWYKGQTMPVLSDKGVVTGRVPDVKGMGLRDALYLLENMHIKVQATGIGKVKTQSIEPGMAFTKNQTLLLELN